jgi:probable HAF family extracellular repeat protein
MISKRMGRGLITFTFTLPVIVMSATTGHASGSCTPRIIDMGTLGGHESEIDGANRVGDWVGSAQNAHGKDRAVLWHDGAMIDLGEPGAWAGDITNAGVVVGNSRNGAFTWYRGTARLLPIPAWANGSYVRRINQHDDAVGVLISPDGTGFPTEWQHLRHIRLLPVPSGFNGGEGLGINDAGDVVGDVSNDSGQVAWEWGHDGTSHALPPVYGQGLSQANVVNDRGWAAGGLDFGGRIGLWAAVWRNGTMSKLGQLGKNRNFSFALGEDQLGDYVGGGTYTINDPFLHVFITHVGMGHLLTMLPLSGNQADRSNAHAAVPSYQGEPSVAVGGSSTTTSGDYHATVWTCAYQQAFVPNVTTITSATRDTSAAALRHREEAVMRDLPTDSRPQERPYGR